MKQVTNEIRKEILVSLKGQDKRQSEIRKDLGISQENRSTVDYHLDYLLGEENAKFKDNPLIEKYREEGTPYYTLNEEKLSYNFNTEYFMPHIYLAAFQMLVAVGALFQFGHQVFLGYITSAFVSTILVSLWIAFNQDIREVYYTDEEPDRDDRSISDIVSTLSN